jgi:hypothetical protein
MGEPDLIGFDDCGADFAEGDTDTLEHVRHSGYWAINTERGQDWEEPSRWLSIESFMESFVRTAIAAHAASVSTDLTEVDGRILKAVYTVVPGEVMTWTAEITTAQGTTFIEGPLQSLPQDAEQETDDTPAFSAPVAAGVKSIRQVAVEGGKDGALFPYWILGPNAGRVIYSVGLLMDMAAEWLYQGIQQRFPLVADEGALPHLGRDLGILRGLRESTDAYRRRLSLWAPTHRRAGTPFAILEQAQAYFSPQSPRVHLVQHDPGAGGKPTRATWSIRHPDGTEETHVESPSNWDWDSEDPLRPDSLDTRDPRVWLIVEQPTTDDTCLFAPRTSAQAVARDPDGMNGCVRPDGSQAPADQYRDLRDIVQKWRAMGTWVAAVLIYFGEIDTGGTGTAYPDGRWFDPLNDALDGNRIPQTFRVLFANMYPDNRLPESPEPYPV